jgi:hypothetical protein
MFILLFNNTLDASLNFGFITCFNFFVEWTHYILWEKEALQESGKAVSPSLAAKYLGDSNDDADLALVIMLLS